MIGRSIGVAEPGREGVRSAAPAEDEEAEDEHHDLGGAIHGRGEQVAVLS